LALDFDVSAFGEDSGKLRELAPDHDAMPLGATIVRTGIILPARFRGKRKRGHESAVFQLARLGI